jgi:type I restriction enzyme S subunit
MEKQLPKKWVQTNLETIIERMSNGSGLKQFEEPFENSFPISRIETIWNETIDLDRVKYVNPTQADIVKYSFLKGDVLFSHINSDKHLGKTAVFNLDTVLIHGINLLLLRAQPQFNGYLLNYFLRYYRLTGKFIEVAQRSVNQSSINQKKLNTFKIPLPPLAEQNRIVAKLDTLFAQLETIKVSMSKIPVLLKDFRQQVLTQAVTGKLTEEWRNGKELEEWNQKKLSAIADIIDPHPSHRTPPEFENGIPYIGIGDIDKNGKIDFYNSRKISPSVHEEHLNRYSLNEGDFIFGKIGTLGKPIIIPHKQDYTLSANVILIKPKVNVVNSKFIFYYLDSSILMQLIKADTKSTSQPAYGIKKMREQVIPFPSLEEQKEIVSRVESLFTKADAIEQQYKTLKEKIDNLPQALLHKAFKGELTEQLERDGDARELLLQIQELKGATTKVAKNAKLEKLKDFNKKIKKYPKSEDIVGMVAEGK